MSNIMYDKCTNNLRVLNTTYKISYNSLMKSFLSIRIPSLVSGYDGALMPTIDKASLYCSKDTDPRLVIYIIISKK